MTLFCSLTMIRCFYLSYLKDPAFYVMNIKDGIVDYIFPVCIFFWMLGVQNRLINIRNSENLS